MERKTRSNIMEVKKIKNKEIIFCLILLFFKIFLFIPYALIVKEKQLIVLF